MSKIICIDAGHGGKDAGAVNGLRYEKNDNLRFALALGESLKKQGFTVFQTRTTDANVSLQSRTNFANRVKADYFVSLHRNSFSSSSAFGLETWVYKNTNTATMNYATAIQNELVKVGVQANRGVKKGNFHVCRETTMSAVLVELNFIKNAKDNELYDNNFYKYVEAITKAICITAKVEYKTIQLKPTPPPVKPQLPPPNYTNYTVKRGDGFWKIASQQMGSWTKMYKLASFNGLKLTSTITPGQTLRIPK